MIAQDYLTPSEAHRAGYRAMTVSYLLPREREMLDNVIEDMERGEIDAAIVTLNKDDTLVEVWRKPHRPELN